MGTRLKKQKNSVSRWSRFTTPLLAVVVLVVFSGGGGGFAAHLENNDGFCASCHTEPESEYFQRSQTADPVDMAAWHTGKETRCIDCHSGTGVSGRVSAMLLGAGDLFKYVTQTDVQPAPLTSPIPDSHCLKCHEDVPATRDFNLHFHSFLDDWQGLDPNAGTCVDCHSAHTTDGKADLGFLNEERAVEVCSACHTVAGEGPRN